MANTSLTSISAAKLMDLLNESDPHREFRVWVLNQRQLALGAEILRPTLLLDLSREKSVPYDPEELAGRTEPSGATTAIGTLTLASTSRGSRVARRSGEYWFALGKRRVECRSLKELLSNGLRALEEHRPGTLEKLFHVKPRSRRIVARHPQELFDRDDLIEKYSEQLMHGWWYGTNNSARETELWLQRACRCAGLAWRQDFVTSLAHAGDTL